MDRKLLFYRKCRRGIAIAAESPDRNGAFATERTTKSENNGMNRLNRFTIALAGAAALSLAGCQGAALDKPEASTTPDKPEASTASGKPRAEPAALSAEAAEALAKAEADVKAAQDQKALWTTALEALKLAKAAAAQYDSAAVVRYSRVASEQAKLGIAQTQYPLTGVGK